MTKSKAAFLSGDLRPLMIVLKVKLAVAPVCSGPHPRVVEPAIELNQFSAMLGNLLDKPMNVRLTGS